jgi:hypothetical protein
MVDEASTTPNIAKHDDHDPPRFLTNAPAPSTGWGGTVTRGR